MRNGKNLDNKNVKHSNTLQECFLKATLKLILYLLKFKKYNLLNLFLRRQFLSSILYQQKSEHGCVPSEDEAELLNYF